MIVVDDSKHIDPQDVRVGDVLCGYTVDGMSTHAVTGMLVKSEPDGHWTLVQGNEQEIVKPSMFEHWILKSRTIHEEPSRVGTHVDYRVRSGAMLRFVRIMDKAAQPWTLLGIGDWFSWDQICEIDGTVDRINAVQ